MPKLIGYAPTGLVYNPRRNSWGLRVGFDPTAAAGFVEVSPDSGLLVHGADVKRLFEEDEVLVPAKFLADQNRPELLDRSCTMHHLLFAYHQVVMVNGLWSESLLEPPSDPGWITDLGVFPPRGVFHTCGARSYLSQDQAELLQRQRAIQMQPANCMLA
ncbi:Hint domain-containing protein [Pelagimonas varians]|uniref:Hint domain-containing protein n=1 Tax=Pelagimonas varians TaxID=696760 RepID=UPI000BEF0D85|nr:Hint domain-containing protein [Pelagimonas varians]PYG29194.1 Hint domain-containing protein [Pelagimonas varians]